MILKTALFKIKMMKIIIFFSKLGSLLLNSKDVYS